MGEGCGDFMCILCSSNGVATICPCVEWHRFLGYDVEGRRFGVGQRDADDGHRLVPRPVAVRVRADDLGPSDVGLILRGVCM